MMLLKKVFKVFILFFPDAVYAKRALVDREHMQNRGSLWTNKNVNRTNNIPQIYSHQLF